MKTAFTHRSDVPPVLLRYPVKCYQWVQQKLKQHVSFCILTVQKQHVHLDKLVIFVEPFHIWWMTFLMWRLQYIQIWDISIEYRSRSVCTMINMFCLYLRFTHCPNFLGIGLRPKITYGHIMWILPHVKCLKTTQQSLVYLPHVSNVTNSQICFYCNLLVKSLITQKKKKKKKSS